MKKIYSFLFAATALFAAVSCQKEVAPEVEAPKGEKITFTASTEVETKTALHENGKSTIWVEGDQISVFDANKEGNNRCFAIDELSEDAKTATFSYEGEFVKDQSGMADPTVVALYPYQPKAYCDFFYYDRNYITGINFPAEQTAVAGSFDSKAAFALGLGTMNKKDLGFQNLYALLKFTVRDAGVKKVTVKVNEGAYIAGDAKIQMDLNTEKIGGSEPVFESPVLSIVENGSNTITLTCEDGFDTEATYYVAVVPTTFTSISLYCDDDLVNHKDATMTLEANKIYNLKDNGSPKKERGLAFAATTATATVGKSFTAPTLSGVDNDALEGVEYVSSNTSVAVVDASGNVTVKAAGETTITAKAAESRYYLAGEASYELTVEPHIQLSRGLSFSENTVTITYGDDFTGLVLSGVTDGVTYISSKTSVASVNSQTGEVEIKGVGTTEITASAPETYDYEAGTATYTLTVNPSTVRLYVESEKTGFDMRIYAWGIDGVDLPNAWPGESLTWDATANKYYYEFPYAIKGKELSFIVNVNGDECKTADQKVTFDANEETFVLNWKWLYLEPNSNWKQSSAKFAAYFFTKNQSGEYWQWMMKLDTNYYGCVIPGDYKNVIFCRMNSSATNMNWDNKWNQTGDLTVPTNGNNLFTLLSSTWDGATTTWSKKTF